MKTSYNCTNCSYYTPKWLGCCPSCNEWNTIEEKQQESSHSAKSKNGSLLKMNNNIFEEIDQKRIVSGISEWDRVMGDGIVPGSFLLVSGDPGIGKSTLLLQVAHQLAQYHKYYNWAHNKRWLCSWP